jgi:hypothetical protein
VGDVKLEEVLRSSRYPVSPVTSAQLRLIWVGEAAVAVSDGVSGM